MVAFVCECNLPGCAFLCSAHVRSAGALVNKFRVPVLQCLLGLELSWQVMAAVFLLHHWNPMRVAACATLGRSTHSKQVRINPSGGHQLECSQLLDYITIIDTVCHSIP